jgi:hypothetical protein
MGDEKVRPLPFANPAFADRFVLRARSARQAAKQRLVYASPEITFPVSRTFQRLVGSGNRVIRVPEHQSMVRMPTKR